MLLPYIGLIATLLPAFPQATTPAVPADAVRLAPPEKVADLDADRLKGEPWRVAWSPDGKALYVQTMRRDRNGNERVEHYEVPAGGGALRSIEAEPAWAAQYWIWKSGRAAPGSPAFRIEVDSQRQVVQSTSTPKGAAIAGMGGDPTAGAAGGGVGPGTAGAAGGVNTGALGAAGQAQNAQIVTLRLKGQVIGEWVNAPMVPGLTFGWAPQALNLVAFANKDAHLVVMDEAGITREVEGTRDVRLPAWSGDGSAIAYVQRTGRNKFQLLVSAVSR